MKLLDRSIHLASAASLNYLLYAPDNYSANSSNFPLMVFLHGGGGCGNNIELVKRHGLPKELEAGLQLPFIVLAPQNPHTKQFWDEVALVALINHIVEEHNIDRSRIYLTGISRGGYGAWRLAINNPRLFAALAVICGASAPYVYAGYIAHMPIQVYHGAKDAIIPLQVSEQMVEALRRRGCDVRFTIFPEGAHAIWDEVYQDKQLYNWFLRHNLGCQGDEDNYQVI